MIENDGVDSEVSVGDEWIVYNVLANIPISIASTLTARLNLNLRDPKLRSNEQEGETLTAINFRDPTRSSESATNRLTLRSINLSRGTRVKY